MGSLSGVEELALHIQWRDRAGFAPASLEARTEVLASCDRSYLVFRSTSFTVPVDMTPPI